MNKLSRIQARSIFIMALNLALAVAIVFINSGNTLMSQAIGYSITLNNTNAPTLNNGQGTKLLGCATFTYENASSYTGGHVTLNEDGYILKDQAKGLTSIVASFSGSLYVLSGYTSSDFCYTNPLTSGVSTAIKGNYIKIGTSETSSISSVTITYSCTTASIESHSYSPDWSYDEQYHWHDCNEPNCSAKDNIAEHDFVIDRENSIEPSNGDPGFETFACSICDAYYERQFKNYSVGSWTQNDIIDTITATAAQWPTTSFSLDRTELFSSGSDYRKTEANAAVKFDSTGGYLLAQLPKVNLNLYDKVYVRFSANGNGGSPDLTRMAGFKSNASDQWYAGRGTEYFGCAGTGTRLINYETFTITKDGVYQGNTKLGYLSANQVNGLESIAVKISDSPYNLGSFSQTIFISDLFIHAYSSDEHNIDESPIDIDLSASSYSLDVDNEAVISSIYWNESLISTSKLISTSSFGGAFGEAGNLVVNYSVNNYEKTALIPITLCTKILKTASDVTNFLSLADLVNGVVGDNIYDGHFILGNDIAYNGTYEVPMHGIPNTPGQSEYGFRGTFDGRGYVIDNIAISSSGSTESTDRVTGFISRLTTTGILKNTGFTNITTGWCGVIVGWGEGAVENVYVHYKAGAPWTDYFATFNNTQSSINNGGVTVKNCIIDARQLTTFRKKLVGDQFENRYNYQGVYCLVPDLTYPLLRKAIDRDSLEKDISLPYSINYDVVNGYLTYSSLLKECEVDILSWDCFHKENGALYFGNKLLTTDSAATSTTHNFIDDYTVVCDTDNIDSVKAASLVVEQLFKAGGTVSYQKLESNTPIYNKTHTGGTAIHKVGGATYSSDANLIVVGNENVEQQAGLSTTKSKIITKDNSIFIMSKNSKDLLATAIEFLTDAIGFKMLGDNVTYYGSIPSSIPSINKEFDVAFASRNRTNYVMPHNYDSMGLNGVATVDELTAGPVDSNGNVVAIHNSLTWLPKATYSTAHPNWYRSDGTDDVCFTAHGNSSELTAMVNETAMLMRNVLINNPNEHNLTFSLQDTDYDCCDCSACSSAYSTYGGSYAGAAISFMNRVAERIIELDTQNNISNRDFTLYILGYYYLFTAPSNITINSHVGVYIAPLHNSYEALSIYHSKNASAKASIEKWCSLTDNIMFWYYSAYFRNLFNVFDNFESSLTWLEHIYYLTNGKCKLAYMQGVPVVKQLTGFQAFKQYMYSRALIEIGSKINAHSSYANEDAYNIAIKNYLIELENEFFGISNRTSTSLTEANLDSTVGGYTFNDTGFYGNASANMNMYKLYRYQRFFYQDMLTVGGFIQGDSGVMNGAIYERYDYARKSTSAYSSSGTRCAIDVSFFQDTNTYYFCPNYTKTILTKMMGYYESAVTAINSYSHAAIEIFKQNIMIESLMPRFFICMSKTSVSAYNFLGGYNGTTLQNMRVAFKTDCQSIGYDKFAETTDISYLYAKWGV